MSETAAKAPEEKLGSVITFYSFKGGVGRSMALANVAVLLARLGKRVLCIDWDLEAPGLDRYFRAIPRSSPTSIPRLSAPKQRGGLLAVLQKSSSATALENWRDYVRKRTTPEGTTLDLIGSGDDDEEYTATLSEFSWSDFFLQQDGGEIVEALRREWKQNYEYVLIDSRTGLTDSSGICTIQMPDLIVMLFAANDQNVDWCQKIARGIRRGRAKLPYERTFLPILPLLSRFDAREESDRASEAMDKIAAQFAPFFADWLPRSITARDMLAWSVLPYVPRYSFEEALAVEDEPATGAQGLSFYYQLLTRLIDGRFKSVRSILASVGVPGAALPPLLPGTTELDAELSKDFHAVDRYVAAIRMRSEEEPLEALEALEALSAACVSANKLADAKSLLTEAVAILDNAANALPEEHDRLNRKRAEIAARIGKFRKRFRVALSFAGEKRAFVSEVASHLAQRLGESAILYDRYHESEFARARVGEYLWKLYSEEVDLVVIILSGDYSRKEWSGLELAEIIALLKRRSNSEILLCRFGDAELKGIFSISDYLGLDDKNPAQTAKLILQRLAVNERRTPDYYIETGGSLEGPVDASIQNNLPRLESFFGRNEELRQLSEALDPAMRTWGILIDGPGGVGKTALAVRAAYDCSPGQFDRIIFLSVRDRELDVDGEHEIGTFILPGFIELLNELAHQLDKPDITKSSENERVRMILDALITTKALLILDNLDSLTRTDADQLLAFVKRLPQGSKAILTSRQRIVSGVDVLALGGLGHQAGLEYLTEIAKHNKTLGRTSESDRIKLLNETNGNPLLLRWGTVQLGKGSCRTIDDLIALLRSCSPSSDPLEFMFGDLANQLADNESKVIAALTYFTVPATLDALVDVTQLSRKAVQGALATLTTESLIMATQRKKAFFPVPIVADFVRRRLTKQVAEVGGTLERRAYGLIQENGYENYDRFPALDRLWPVVAPALPLFVIGPNSRLQKVCDALAEFLNFTGRWDELLSLLAQAETKAIQAGDTQTAGWRAYRSGWVHSLRQQANDVLACADRAATHWQAANAGPRESARAIRLRGMGYDLKSDYSAAISSYRESLKLDMSLSPDSRDVAGTLNDLADTERRAGDLDSAERDYREALRIVKAIEFTEGEPLITGNLSLLAIDRRDWVAAEALATQALHLSELLGRQEMIAQNAFSLSRALVEQSRASEALSHAQRAIEIYTRLGLPQVDLARAVLRRCEALLQSKQPRSERTD